MIMHGVELDRNGRPQFLRFGWAQLLGRLSVVQPDVLADLPGWARRWRTPGFSRVVQSLCEVLWKFDIAAGHVDQCRSVILEWEQIIRSGSVDIASVGTWQTAVRELPLFLDSLLFYLRIGADRFAVALPYLHDQGGRMPPRFRSFREHRKWVIKQGPAFDPDYADILVKKTGWFEELAGKDPRGFRDILVHDVSSYTLDWISPENCVRPWLVCEDGVRQPDVMTAVARMTAGWFAFLDSCWLLFVPRLRELGQRLLPTSDEFARSLERKGVDLPSFWVYPRASA